MRLIIAADTVRQTTFTDVSPNPSSMIRPVFVVKSTYRCRSMRKPNQPATRAASLSHIQIGRVAGRGRWRGQKAVKPARHIRTRRMLPGSGTAAGPSSPEDDEADWLKFSRHAT